MIALSNGSNSQLTNSPGSLIISRLQFERPSILLLNMLDIPLLMKKHWGAHSGSGPVFRKTKKEKG